MTLRDIKIICGIVEHKISLGLPIDFLLLKICQSPPNT